jgi:hypothetical protein
MKTDLGPEELTEGCIINDLEARKLAFTLKPEADLSRLKSENWFLSEKQEMTLVRKLLSGESIHP